MTGITTKIKRFRGLREFSQEQMAQKLNISLKAYQKIENGQTKMDLQRLEEIAKILETTVIDMLNMDEGVYIHNIAQNDGGVNTKQVVIHKNSESEKEAYQKLLETKDQIIADKNKEIEYLKSLIEKLK